MATLSSLSPWMRIPPPLLYIAAFLLGLLIHWRFPLLVPGPVTSIVGLLGIGFVTAGALLALSCVMLFLRARTTIVPHHEARRLVDVGPYRISRNPMYLALTLVYLGAAVWAGSLWPLLLLPIPLAVIHLVVIPTEERILSGALGYEYEAYRMRVRRWL